MCVCVYKLTQRFAGRVIRAQGKSFHTAADKGALSVLTALGADSKLLLAFIYIGTFMSGLAWSSEAKTASASSPVAIVYIWDTFVLTIHPPTCRFCHSLIMDSYNFIMPLNTHNPNWQSKWRVKVSSRGNHTTIWRFIRSILTISVPITNLWCQDAFMIGFT